MNRKGKNNPMFGRHLSAESKRKIGLKSLGRRHSKETRLKMSQSQRLENNPRWTGDECTVSALHKRVRRHLGKPKKCEHCGRSDVRLQWANKSHKYKRDLTDWIALCIPCHKKYDYAWILRRSK